MQKKKETKTARTLRETPTKAESQLWRQLRTRRLKKYKFKRQHPIPPYYVDFVCLKKRLIIELDGGQHANKVDYDERRTAYLQAKGFQVMRFWNNEVYDNIQGVLQVVLQALEGVK